jgi:hypothetical protein
MKKEIGKSFSFSESFSKKQNIKKYLLIENENCFIQNTCFIVFLEN